MKVDRTFADVVTQTLVSADLRTPNQQQYTKLQQKCSAHAKDWRCRADDDCRWKEDRRPGAGADRCAVSMKNKMHFKPAKEAPRGRVAGTPRAKTTVAAPAA
jgi:hypothetical protein